MLHLKHATDALNLLGKIAGSAPPFWRLWGIVTSILNSERLKRFGLACLVLDNPSTKAAGTSPALDALLALAGPCAYAAQVVAVSCAPTPATDIVGISIL